MSSKLKWTQEEQSLLKQLVKIHEGKRKWVIIAEKMNQHCPDRQRTSKQCRQKYINHVQYSQGLETMKWTSQDQHYLFQQYLKKGSQWKHISNSLPGKSQNAVKNKFYGKIRKLVRKLNSICRQRINRSNKPLRDQSIMRIIDVKQGFENLPQNLISQSDGLKGQLLSLAQTDMNQFEQWDLINQTNVVNLIKKIHKFNINSRYYCSRKKKTLSMKKIAKQMKQHKEVEEKNRVKNEQQLQQFQTQNEKNNQFIPIIIVPYSNISQEAYSYKM